MSNLDGLLSISPFERPICRDKHRTSPRSPERRLKVALIGNSLPRLCGIATFTTDLQQALAGSNRIEKASVIAMTDVGQRYAYPANVSLSIAEQELHDYWKAAKFMNAKAYDVVSLQHEFGIFGGPNGNHIVGLVENLQSPLVTTFHTVLAAPTKSQQNIIERITDASARVVVMASKGAQMLAENYDIDPSKISIIPHGIPDVQLDSGPVLKDRMGFAGRTVILTFGLLSPNKGIEVMIDAMPAVLKSCPDALYIVLGATHPHLVRENGESYRESLAARAERLGVAANVMFINQFVERAELLDYIAMCDVYVTPYLSETQLTSGTLAYSFGLGRPIISTPYWHAAELLADGRGILVPFGDSAATGRSIAALLNDPARRQAISQQSYNEGRSMTWPRVAETYVDLFAAAAEPSERAEKRTPNFQRTAA